MSPSHRWTVGLGVVAFAGCVGGCAGFITANGYHYSYMGPSPGVRAFPMPHHVPKYEGGVSLRFAMVHDVIHERFPRHGEAYYRERNRLARQTLNEKPADDVYFGLCDDLGAGLDYLKQDDEAVTVLREKLRRQQALGYNGRQLYTTYANLGTFLIHGNARAAFAGDAAAKEKLREGLAFIQKSIEVNPEAHFGREVWQAVAAEYLLAVSENPKLLLQFDMVGNSLTEDVNARHKDSIIDADAYVRHEGHRDAELFLKSEGFGRARPAGLRDEFITKVGAETGWNEATHSTHKKPVSFDEPVLGIIGMWRLGGGASPHFALALAEIMLRVGQRYIAWCAFERAAILADRVWTDKNIQRQFAEHCRRRQKAIEQQLPEQEVAALRPRFEAELAHGQDYQKQYQDYEAERISTGASIDDPNLYDKFNAAHLSIASPVGNEDRFLVALDHAEIFFDWPFAAFAAGAAAFVAGSIFRFATQPRTA